MKIKFVICWGAFISDQGSKQQDYRLLREQSCRSCADWEGRFLVYFCLQVHLISRAAEGKYFDSCCLNLFDLRDFSLM